LAIIRRAQSTPEIQRARSQGNALSADSASGSSLIAESTAATLANREKYGSAFSLKIVINRETTCVTSLSLLNGRSNPSSPKTLHRSTPTVGVSF
jgi:hypothetical protein